MLRPCLLISLVTAVALAVVVSPTASRAAIIVNYETLLAGSGFNFATIDDPSALDTGDSATITVHANSPVGLDGGSAPVTALGDGVTTSPVYALNGTTSDIQYVYDLGSSQNIRQINAYSYHTDLRAPVTMSAWGANSLLSAGGSSGAATVTTLKTAGWTEIVGVGSPTVSGRESGVQISDSTGSLGNYRYLLLNVSRNGGGNDHPFMREIDVYTGGVAEGIDIAITNPSFEATPITTGWTVSGGTLAFDEGFASSTNVPPPEGIRSLGLRANTVGNPIMLSQTLGTLADLGEYTLSFFVADRIAEQWLNYKVELLAGANVLISEDSALNSALRPRNGSTDYPSDILFGSEGDWRNVVLSGSTTFAMIGQPLTIRFTSTLQSNDNGTHNDFALDNVQLSFVAVPEPSTFALGLLGLIGLASLHALRRRARR